MSNYDVKFDQLDDNSSWKRAFTLIRPGSNVLDVGCSKGDFGRALKQYKGCKVDGIEPNRKDAAMAGKVLRRIFTGTVEDVFTNISTQSHYDYVVFLDVIEHLYDPVEILREVAKHLCPGGSIVFSIPNVAHISIRLMILKGKFEYGKTGLLDQTHVHFYTRKEIERLFHEAGYVVNAIQKSEVPYPKALIVQKLKELGIEPTEKILRLFNSESARVFQYIGIASVSQQKINIKERPNYSPDPQGEVDRFNKKYRRDLL